jgi:hypothetical protein
MMIPLSLRNTFPAAWCRALVASTVGGAILISGCGGDAAGGSGSVDIGKAKEAAVKKGIASSRAAAARGRHLKGMTAVARLGDIKRTKNGRR